MRSSAISLGLLCIVLSTASCDESQAPEQPEAAQSIVNAVGPLEARFWPVRQRVAAELLDPPSAYFRDVELRATDEGEVVCGSVSGRNGFGGYGQPMAFSATADEVTIVPPDPGEGSDMRQAHLVAHGAWLLSCSDLDAGDVVLSRRVTSLDFNSAPDLSAA